MPSPDRYLSRQWHLLLLTLIVLHLIPATETALSLTRTGLQQGQWWRAITGHFIHTNTLHLLLNGMALMALYLLHRPHYRHLWLRILLLSAAISLAIYRWSPELTSYLGLSGVLHGLLAWGAIEDLQRRWYSGGALLAAVTAKVAYEQLYGPNAATASLIAANVAVNAHLYGYLSGLCCATLPLLCRRLLRHGADTPRLAFSCRRSRRVRPTGSGGPPQPPPPAT